MKNLLFLFLLSLSLNTLRLQAQSCNPPSADTCEYSNILCGLEELDGYKCSNPNYENPTGPQPSLCFGQGVTHNTNWWAFVGNGTNIQFTFEFDPADCNFAGTACNGIQAGILVDCGGATLDCNAACNTSTFSLQGVTNNCHIYYVWVDGCCGDVCNYTIRVLEGKPAKIPTPLPDISVNGQVCEGNQVDICVGNLKGECEVPIRWTIDGVDAPGWDNRKCIGNFPVPKEEVEFCVTWILGNPANADAICDEQSKCYVLTPEPAKQSELPPEYVCYNDHKGKYTWKQGNKDTTIYSSCIDPPCKLKVKDSSGCYVNYSKEITLLPERKTGRKFLFSCDTAAFIAEDGSRLDTSVCDFPITWKTPQGAYGQLCDSTYYLNLELFRPEVALSIDKNLGHGREFVLIAHKTYSLKCLPGTIQLTGFWMTPDAQRIQGDTLHLHPSEDSTGLYQYFIHVEYADTLHPSNNVSCDYITQQSFNLESCTLVFPETENLLCISKNQVQFDLDFSWLGMTGDSFTLSSANQMLGTYAFSDLPVTIKDFIIGDTDSTYQFKICGTGPASCCLDYSIFIPVCKGTATSGVHILSNRIRYSGSTKTLHISVPSAKRINLDIYHVSGIKILNSSLHSGQNSIDINATIPGMYIAVLSNENGQMVDVFRFVVL